MKKSIQLIIYTFFIIHCLSAQSDGTLDTNFDTDGKVFLVEANDQFSRAVVVQSDGKIIVAGDTYTDATHQEDIRLVRFMPDGTLDNTFGNSGIVTTDVALKSDIASAIVLQTDGKIVVAGDTYNGTNFDVVVVRYNANGTLDNSFGSNGIAIFNSGSNERALALALQNNGKIVIGGWYYSGSNWDFALIRLNINGTLDNSFGANGRVATDIDNTQNYANAIAVQSDGKIVVVGDADSQFAVARYNSNGSLDNSFSGDGKLRFPIGTISDVAYGVAIQNDGKIVLAGQSNTVAISDFAMARLNTDGTFDSSFSGDGMLTTDITGGGDYAYFVSIKSNGLILAGGLASGVALPDFAMVRYRPDGQLDNNFGNGGIALTDIDNGSNDVANAIAIQTDGKIILSGYSTKNTENDFALIRLNASPDFVVPTYQLTVNNGYGSGLYAEGDTVHVWAKEWPLTKAFSHWSGDTSWMTMPDEWHTTIIMPAQVVTVLSHTKNLPVGGNLTFESIMGRDTLKPVHYHFPSGGPQKGVVWLWHGSGGSAQNWVQKDFEMRTFVNYLIANGVGVIITESEESTKNQDTDGDGKIRYVYSGDTINNVDLANVRAIRDTFIHRGKMTWSTPQVAEGFSAGGAFSTLIASLFLWKAGITHNAQAVSAVIPVTEASLSFSMTYNDNHPEVGTAGNLAAFQNYENMVNNGQCATFYLLYPSPAYPERFMRVPGVSGVQSLAIFNELVSNGCLNAKNYFVKSPTQIENMVINNPANWPAILALTPIQRDYALDQIAVMWTGHHFHTEFAAKDLKFILNPCDQPVSTQNLVSRSVLTLYPNPATDRLYIPKQVSGQCSIFDINGRLIRNYNADDSREIDVSNLTPGLYFFWSNSGCGKFVRDTK